MLKISEVGTAGHSVTLKLEGRVVGPWVGELRRVCERLMDEGRALKLDLTDVSFADAGGVSELSRLRWHGVALANCSAFVEEQLKSG